MKKILVDGRWRGLGGIARFSSEILTRLKNVEVLTGSTSPLSIPGMIYQSYVLATSKPQVFFTPGFNPVLGSRVAYVLTIHDLLHLERPNKHAYLKKMFFEKLMYPAITGAAFICTVSEYSKSKLISWTQVAPEKIVVVGNGVSPVFKQEGTAFLPGFPYLLYVGNNKEHKNIPRLIMAFKQARIDVGIRLICTCQFNDEIKNLIVKLKLEDRVLSHPALSEDELANYYRGALGVTFPSLYEGFGLPIVEAMASGTPVLTSQVTSLPEIAGKAAVLINPYEVESIADGIEKLVNDIPKRQQLIAEGVERATLFSWDKVATRVQNVLDAIAL